MHYPQQRAEQLACPTQHLLVGFGSSVACLVLRPPLQGYAMFTSPLLHKGNVVAGIGTSVARRAYQSLAAADTATTDLQTK